MSLALLLCHPCGVARKSGSCHGLGKAEKYKVGVVAASEIK